MRKSVVAQTLFSCAFGVVVAADGVPPFTAPGRFVHDAERPVAATGMKLVSRPSPWYGRMPGSLKVWATEDADGTCGKRLLAETGVLPPCYAGESQFLTWSATTSRYWLVEVDKSGTDAIVRHGQYMNWAGFSERGVWGFPHNKDGKASPNLIDIARVELFTELPAVAPRSNPAGLACPEHRLVKDWLMRDFGVEEGARRYSTVGYDAGYVARCRVRRAERLKRLRAFADRIVYVKHYTMGGDAELHGTALVSDEPVTGRPTNFRAGGALCLLTILPDGSVTNEVLVSCPNGCIRDPDVSHDGRTLVFSMRESFNENVYIKARHKGEPTRERAFPYDFYTKLEGDDYHLYTLNLETRNLRQITFSVPAPCADIEPCWTSDGRIVFQSSRCEQVIPCHQTMDLNLYSCDADGGNVRRLAIDGGSTSHPVELPDGRILYTRYEYNDRCARLQQPLFSMRADGTDQTAFYGNASAYPASLLHFRPIPESTALLGIVSGHHVHQVGKLARLDPRLGTEGDDGLTFVAGSDLEGKGLVVHSAYAKNPKMARGRCPHGYDFAFQAGPLWQNPYPISEKEFLVSFLPEGSLTIKYHLNPGFGIYWQDEMGDRELLAYDPTIECSQPVPVRLRQKAHAFAAKPLDWETAFGIFHVQNVYFGPGVEGVKPGTVKKLRVVAVENRPTYTYSAPMGQKGESCFDDFIAYDGDWSGEAITLGGSWDVKHVLGEVDVNPDGSCLFRCPALNAVYFQLLDERGRCVQTMRSWTHLQPGETAGCLGCHESKRTAYPPTGKTYTGNVQEIRPAPGQPPHQLLVRLKSAGRWPLLASTANYMGVNAPRATASEAPVEGFSYRALVQPILDRNCVKCHDGKGEAAKRPNLTGAWRRDVNPRAHRKFSESYAALTRNGYQTRFCNWYSSGGRSAMLPPYAQGSCASRLMDFFDGKHKGVRVTEAEYRVVACWLDLAIPFGGSYCEATDWTDDDRKVYDYHQRKREAFVRTEMENVRAKIGADASGARWVNSRSNSMQPKVHFDTVH